MIMPQLELPPGIAYLLGEVLPYTLLLSALTAASFHLLSTYTVLSFPTWSYWVGLVLIHPAVRFGKLWYLQRSQYNEMVAKGAIPIPTVQASSRDIIKAIIRSFSIGYAGEVYQSWAIEYGNVFTLNIFSEPRVITMEPEHVKAVLSTQFHEFEKAATLLSQWKDLLGTGVFNADGDMWKFHRNMTRPFFSKDRISDFDNFERHAVATIALMKDRLKAGHPVEFQDAVSRFTLDSATEFLFGKDVESLSAGLPYPASSQIRNPESYENHPSNVFVRAFMQGQEAAALRTRFGTYWKLQELWSNKIKGHRAVVDQFVQPMVKHAYAKKRAGLFKEDSEVTDLLSNLVREIDDEKTIKDELVNILVASRDTTASLITFGTYALTRNPAITKRLRDEIASVVGKRAPTYNDIREMKYMRAFLNETLRLYPSVPFDSRTSNVATTLPNKDGAPYYLAKNTKVIYALFWLHRREDLWGPTALEFDPDRFIDDRLRKYLTRNPFIFMPFNAGPRICLGQQFAYNEASYFFVRLLQTFSSFSIAEEAQSPASQPPKEWFDESAKVPGSTKDKDTIMFGIHLTMFAKGGLWLNMTEDPGAA